MRCAACSLPLLGICPLLFGKWPRSDILINPFSILKNTPWQMTFYYRIRIIKKLELRVGFMKIVSGKCLEVPGHANNF
jgi:hypothetical protein